MNVVPAVVADEGPLELVEPGEGALDDPADAAEAGAVIGLSSGDLGGLPALTKPVTHIRLVVFSAQAARCASTSTCVPTPRWAA